MKKQNAPSKGEKIGVMIVDDHPIMRNALRSIISAEPDLSVVAEADSGQSAIDLLAGAKPDVVLMDGSMPRMTGMEATRRLRELQPTLRIIGLTLYGETSYRDEMAEAGASGYLLKTGAPSQIVEAIRIVARGGTFFEPTIPRPSTGSAQERAPTEELSAEELAVVKLVANGQSNAEIAESLGLSLPEVETRRSAAMKRLGLRNRAELVRVAVRYNWLEV